jgi:glycosyltransferase A (GT-A) superfamily protein (DUF2064 family)
MNDYWKKCCLLIFESNRDAIGYQGLVKEIGSEKALAVYNGLLKNTSEICKDLKVSKQIWSEVEKEEIWDEYEFEFYKNQGNGHSAHLEFAFQQAFEQGFRKVIALKADTLQLTTKILEEAFLSLKFIEFCIGPEDQGGFYLIGMNQFEQSVFYNKDWKSATLCKSVIKEIGALKLALYKTKTLPTITAGVDIELFMPNIKH